MEFFRACDIRGVYPGEVNEDLFFRLGKAIAERHVGTGAILIGSDVRLSSEYLRKALAAGLVEYGATVFDAGACPTPVIYFGRRAGAFTAAAIVTASHNPPQYNGLKLLLGDRPALPEDISGLREALGSHRGGRPGGSLMQVDLVREYGNQQVALWQRRFGGFVDWLSSGEVVIDPGNGAWSGVAGEILRQVGLRIHPLHDAADGRFPNRLPDCAAPANIVRLCEVVRERRALVGIAWDGDGDRAAFCDERGCVVSADRIALLLLPSLLAGTSGEKVLVDVKISKKVSEVIRSHRAIPVVQKSAHCLLENTMIDLNCRFGCEFSGHYFYRELGGSDDALYSALLLLHVLAEASVPMSQMIAGLPEMFITPDIRFHNDGADLAQISRRLARAFPEGRFDRLDGVRIETPDGWFLLRQSVSERKLSCRFEGNSTQGLQCLILRVLDFLPEYRNVLLNALQPPPQLGRSSDSR